MFFVIHVDSSFFEFFDGNVIFDEPVAVVFEVNNIIDGNVQKPDHDIESFLVNFHDIVHPKDDHEKGVGNDKGWNDNDWANLNGLVVG